MIERLDSPNWCSYKGVMVDGKVMMKAQVSGIISLLPLAPPSPQEIQLVIDCVWDGVRIINPTQLKNP